MRAVPDIENTPREVPLGEVDADILPRAENWFRDLVVAYRAGEMRRWWDEGGRPEVG